MKKIKVLFISRSVYPLFNSKCSATFGGSEVDVFHISTELAKDKNYHVFCATGNFGQKPKENQCGVELIRTYNQKDFYLKKMYLIAKTIIKVKPHYLFLQGSITSTLPIFLLCRLIGTKPVFKFASMNDLKYEKMKNPFLYIGLLLSHRIICQTTEQKNALEKFTSFRSIIIKNGIREKLFKKNSLKKYFLWVGRSAQVKRPDIFIDLAKKYPDEKFLMICPKANNNSVNYDSLLRQVKTINNLQFVKYVPFDKIEKYFEKAFCFVSTSCYEGFPNTFVQATMKAVPILSLSVNPDNFIFKNQCGIFSKGDIRRFIKAIPIIKNNFNKYSANCRQYFLDNHDIKTFITQYKKIFK